MKWNRNHYFAIGIVVLLFGVQLRLVESVVLSEETGQFIAKRLEKQPAGAASPFSNLIAIQTPASRRTFTPPRWIGWLLISTGVVLVLHSMAMKPAGSGGGGG